jgi:hypothetical protein
MVDGDSGSFDRDFVGKEFTPRRIATYRDSGDAVTSNLIIGYRATASFVTRTLWIPKLFQRPMFLRRKRITLLGSDMSSCADSAFLTPASPFSVV